MYGRKVGCDGDARYSIKVYSLKGTYLTRSLPRGNDE